MKLLKLLKLNSKGFGHLELFTGVAVIALVAVTGVYISKHHISHAAGAYTQLGTVNGILASVCKTEVPSGYGNIYDVTAFFTKKSGTKPLSYTIADFRLPQSIIENQSSGSGYWGKVIAQVKAYASVPLGDGVVIQIHTNDNTNDNYDSPTLQAWDIANPSSIWGGAIPWNKVANC